MQLGESSIALVDAVKRDLNLPVETILFDATKEIPFEERQFNFAFQCGLLEHFETSQQIELLKNWKKCCKRMMSMIPNASSVPYRVGKKIMEENRNMAWKCPSIVWHWNLLLRAFRLKESIQ